MYITAVQKGFERQRKKQLSKVASVKPYGSMPVCVPAEVWVLGSPQPMNTNVPGVSGAKGGGGDGEGGGGEGEGGGGEGEGKVTVTRASDLHVDTHCCAKLPVACGCKETSTEVASRL